MSLCKKTLTILGVIGALIIILLTAQAITNNSQHSDTSTPTITASPDVTLKEPEPEIKAASDAKLAEEPKPEIITEPAPVVPYNIPSDAPVSTRYYTPPFTAPQYPLGSPQPPLSQPILPSRVQPLPPVVTGPVERLTEPLHPITDPLLDVVEDTLPKLEPCLTLEINTPSSDIPLNLLC